jgi:hypothetical protein
MRAYRRFWRCLAVLALFLNALGQAPAQGSAAAAPEPAPPSGAPASGNRTADGQLLFKGLYLGMPVEEAARRMLGFGLTPGDDGRHGYPSSMLEESPDGRVPHEVGGPWRGTEPLRIRPDANGVPTLLRDTANPWTMQLDAENRVQRLSLSGGATSVLFGSADMSGPEFAKAFLDAYGIPELQAVPVKRGELEQYFMESLFRMGWEYVDREHGWGIRIEEDKTVTITRLARTAETKFD